MKNILLTRTILLTYFSSYPFITSKICMKTGLCVLRVHNPQLDSVIRVAFNLHNGARKNLLDFPVNLKLWALFNYLKICVNPCFGV